MKRIYITGAAGLLGGNLSCLFADRTEIFGCDRNRIHVPGTNLSVLDCMDHTALKKDIERARPDILIHCAAYSSVDGCERDPALSEKMNTELTARIADICREHGIKMIFISSDAVYDGDAAAPHKETDALLPCNVYGKTKMLAEQLLSSEDLILRTNFVGFNIRERLSFFEWILKEMRAGNTLTLFDNVDFSPLSVSAFAEIIRQCICRDLSGVYNACCTGSITKYDFGMLTRSVFGFEETTIIPIKVEESRLFAKRSHHMGMDNSLLANALGIAIDSPRDTILRLYSEYTQSGPDMLRRLR